MQLYPHRPIRQARPPRRRPHPRSNIKLSRLQQQQQPTAQTHTWPRHQKRQKALRAAGCRPAQTALHRLDSRFQ